MTENQIVIGTFGFVILTAITYWGCGFDNIKECFQLWFNKSYWTNFNIIEAVSWLAKAIIIIPGLIFGLQIWWFYWLALITSLGLIWASHKKALPSLVAFNTIWAWIACMVLAQHLVK
jgi:hypothetical protein